MCDYICVRVYCIVVLFLHTCVLRERDIPCRMRYLRRPLPVCSWRRLYYLSAASDMDRSAWMASLQAVVERAAPHAEDGLHGDDDAAVLAAKGRSPRVRACLVNE